MPRPHQPSTNPRTDEFTLLCKLIGARVWQQASNPLWYEPHSEGYAAKMLQNWTVEYVEYINSGVVYRVIRSNRVRAYRLK